MRFNSPLKKGGRGSYRAEPCVCGKLFVPRGSAGASPSPPTFFNRPLSWSYVKVCAQMNDGYTDLRGRFDSALLNTNDLDVANTFSVLILSEEHGALVRGAAPPKR